MKRIRVLLECVNKTHNGTKRIDNMFIGKKLVGRGWLHETEQSFNPHNIEFVCTELMWSDSEQSYLFKSRLERIYQFERYSIIEIY